MVDFAKFSHVCWRLSDSYLSTILKIYVTWFRFAFHTECNVTEYLCSTALKVYILYRRVGEKGRRRCPRSGFKHRWIEANRRTEGENEADEGEKATGHQIRVNGIHIYIQRYSKEIWLFFIGWLIKNSTGARYVVSCFHVFQFLICCDIVDILEQSQLC